jgi:hypothetical protein
MNNAPSSRGGAIKVISYGEATAGSAGRFLDRHLRSYGVLGSALHAHARKHGWHAGLLVPHTFGTPLSPPPLDAALAGEAPDDPFLLLAIFLRSHSANHESIAVAWSPLDRSTDAHLASIPETWVAAGGVVGYVVESLTTVSDDVLVQIVRTALASWGVLVTLHTTAELGPVERGADLSIDVCTPSMFAISACDLDTFLVVAPHDLRPPGKP